MRHIFQNKHLVLLLVTLLECVRSRHVPPCDDSMTTNFSGSRKKKEICLFRFLCFVFINFTYFHNYLSLIWNVVIYGLALKDENVGKTGSHTLNFHLRFFFFNFVCGFKEVVLWKLCFLPTNCLFLYVGDVDYLLIYGFKNNFEPLFKCLVRLKILVP